MIIGRYEIRPSKIPRSLSHSWDHRFGNVYLYLVHFVFLPPRAARVFRGYFGTKQFVSSPPQDWIDRHDENFPEGSYEVFRRNSVARPKPNVI